MRITLEDTSDGSKNDKSTNNNQIDSNTTTDAKKKDTHSIREEIALEKEKVRKKPLKDRILYFITYHKVHVILSIVILLCVFYVFNTILSTKPLSFECFIINSFGLDGENLSNDFSDFANIDNKEFACNFSTSYSLEPKLTSTYELATSQAIEAKIRSANLDVMIIDSACYYQFALESYFCDLRTILTEEEIEKYQDYFYYIDMNDYQIALDNADEFGIDISHITSLTNIEAKNEEGLTHLDPSHMVDPVPVGIIINESPFVVQTQCYTNKVAVLGVLANSTRIEKAISFINYIYDENEEWESSY